MKIAVTGSNGFLGKYFKEFTTIERSDIFFLTTSTPTSDQLICKPLYEDVDIILDDKCIDTIIHFAAVIPTSFADTDYELFSKNMNMMNNLYNFSIKNNVKKFIYISSFGSMNNPKSLDIKDFYTMSKIAGEHFCSMMEAHDIQTASMRISAPYGEHSKARTVLNIFIEKAINNKPIEIFGTGKREQNFTYAGDILQAIELSLNNTISGVYNIVSENNTNMLDLAKIIIKITNSSSELISGINLDPQEDYSPDYDYEKGNIKLGYKPKYTLEDGLNRYIKWLNK